MTMHAADMKDHGENVTLQSAMAKYFASEVCVRNSTEGRTNTRWLWLHKRFSGREILP